uniref:Alcohol dehydrogenase-like C-terminal domain-containing protein n=1 Tax=Lactuca sativa TaxID=4236 RepID=A0A9R1W417_LACSA|nr:hypothetical protein LSAT_V11C300137110 [Lactuca sativa]
MKKTIFHLNIVNRIVFIGLGATWSVSDVSKGSTVAIFGLGTVYKYLNLFLLVAQGAKIRGASTIIGVDTNPEKKEKAKAFGVTDFINPNDIDETVQQGWGVTITLGVPKTNPNVACHYGLFITGRTLKGSFWRMETKIRYSQVGSSITSYFAKITYFPLALILSFLLLQALDI